MVAVERETRRVAPPSSGADGIPAGARRRTGSPRQAFAACTAGAVVLALFAARDLPSWAERTSEGPLSAVLREMARGWDEELVRLDLAVPHEALRRAVRRLIDCHWP